MVVGVASFAFGERSRTRSLSTMSPRWGRKRRRWMREKREDADATVSRVHVREGAGEEEEREAMSCREATRRWSSCEHMRTRYLVRLTAACH